MIPSTSKRKSGLVFTAVSAIVLYALLTTISPKSSSQGESSLALPARKVSPNLEDRTSSEFEVAQERRRIASSAPATEIVQAPKESPSDTPPATLISEPPSRVIGNDVTSEPLTPPSPIPPTPTELPLDVVVAQRIEKEVISKVYCRERLLLFIGVIVQMVGVNENVGNVYVLPRTNVDEFQKTVSGCDVAFRAPVRLTVVSADKHNLTQQIRETLVRSIVSAWEVAPEPAAPQTPSAAPPETNTSQAENTTTAPGGINTPPTDSPQRRYNVNPLFEAALRAQPGFRSASTGKGKKRDRAEYSNLWTRRARSVRRILEPAPAQETVADSPVGPSYVAAEEKLSSRLGVLGFASGALAELVTGNATLTLITRNLAYWGHFYHGWVMPSGHAYLWSVAERVVRLLKARRTIQAVDGDVLGAALLRLGTGDIIQNTSSGFPLRPSSVRISVGGIYPPEPPAAQPSPLIRDLYDWTFGGPPGLDRWANTSLVAVTAGPDIASDSDVSKVIVHWLPRVQALFKSQYGDTPSTLEGAGDQGSSSCVSTVGPTSSNSIGLRILYAPRFHVRDLLRYRGLDPVLQVELLNALNATVELARLSLQKKNQTALSGDSPTMGSASCPPVLTVLQVAGSPKEQYQIVQSHKYFFCPEGAFLSWLLFAPDGSVFVTFLDVASELDNFIHYHQLHLLGRMGQIKFIFVNILTGSLPQLSTVLALAFEAAFRPGVFVVSTNEVQLLLQGDLERYLEQVKKHKGAIDASIQGDANRPTPPLDLAYRMIPTTPIAPSARAGTNAETLPIDEETVFGDAGNGTNRGGRSQLVHLRYGIAGRVQITSVAHPNAALDACELLPSSNSNASEEVFKELGCADPDVAHIPVIPPALSEPPRVRLYRRSWHLEKVNWVDQVSPTQAFTRASWLIRYAVGNWGATPVVRAQGKKKRKESSSPCTGDENTTCRSRQPDPTPWPTYILCRQNTSSPETVSALPFQGMFLKRVSPSTFRIHPSLFDSTLTRPPAIPQEGTPFQPTMLFAFRSTPSMPTSKKQLQRETGGAGLDCLWDFVPEAKDGSPLLALKGRQAVLQLMPQTWDGSTPRASVAASTPTTASADAGAGSGSLPAGGVGAVPLRQGLIVEHLSPSLVTNVLRVGQCQGVSGAWTRETVVSWFTPKAAAGNRGSGRAATTRLFSADGKGDMVEKAIPDRVLVAVETTIRCPLAPEADGLEPPTPLLLDLHPAPSLPGVYLLRVAKTSTRTSKVNPSSTTPQPTEQATESTNVTGASNPTTEVPSPSTNAAQPKWEFLLRSLPNPRAVSDENQKISADDPAPWDTQAARGEELSFAAMFPSTAVGLQPCHPRHWQCLWVCRPREVVGVRSSVKENSTVDVFENFWADVGESGERTQRAKRGGMEEDEETIKFKRLNRRVTLCELELFSHPSTVVVMNPADKTMRLASRFPLSEEGQAPLPTLPIQPTDEIVVLALVL